MYSRISISKDVINPNSLSILYSNSRYYQIDSCRLEWIVKMFGPQIEWDLRFDH
jgi:hypothetical protein